MSVILKPTTMKIRNDGETEFQGFNAVAEAKTSEKIAALEAKATEKITAIENKGNDVLESIPDSYEEIVGSIENITSTTKNILPIASRNVEVRGTTAKYDNGKLIVTGTATLDGGRATRLTPPFTLPAGDYYWSEYGFVANVSPQMFIEKTSDDSIIKTGSGSFTLSEPTEVYVGMNVVLDRTYSSDNVLLLQLEVGTTPSSFIPSGSANDITARLDIEEINSLNLQSLSSIINRFNKDDPENVDGKYMPADQLANLDTYTVSHYIDVSGLKDIMSSYIHMFSWFDENKNYISHDNVSGSDSFDVPITVPTGAKYVRCSFATQWKNVVQIGSHVSRYRYIPYGLYRTPLQKESGTVVVVDINGNGDYTSLLEAMIETSADIIVRYGEYDLVSEYEDYFGSDYFTNPSTYASAAGNFAHGLYINERSVTFDAGTRVIYDLSDIDVSYTEGGADRRFSAIMVGHNAKIIGLNCVGTHNWYVIHDDGGIKDYDYTNEFIDCHIVGSNLVNTNVIGAGCQTRSKTIIDGCYLDNGVNDSNTKTIRYHNTPYAGKPQIIVKDTYVNGKMFFQYFGTQTEKGRVMVNNCSMASAIDLSALSDGMSENWELFAWNNEVRS